jgi:cell division septum initiation protein DivIVA
LQKLLRSSEHGGVDSSSLRAEAERLQSAEPPRAIRGFDEGETRALLWDAAKLLEAAAEEREALQREFEQLRSKARDEVAGKEAIGNALLAATRAAEEMAAEARASAQRIEAEAEARAAAILEQATKSAEQREEETAAERARLEAELAAARARVEEENASARAELERERERLQQEQDSLRGALESERAKVVEEAEAQADAIVAGARHEVERLQSYALRLRSLLIDSQSAFVELAEAALHQLEDDDTMQKTGSGEGELLDDLLPSEIDEQPSPSAIGGD